MKTGVSRPPVVLGVLLVLALALLLVPGPASGTVLHLTYPGPGACVQGGSGLNACIGSATAGSTVTVKPGTYFENNISVFVSGVTITGSCGNPGSVVIDQSATGEAFNVGAPNVTIECLTLRHGGSTYKGIENNGANNNLHVMKVDEFDEEYGVYQDAGTSGLSITGSTFLAMSNYAVAVPSGSTTGMTISGDTFGNMGSDCVYFSSLSNSTISNNNIGPCESEGVEMDGGASNTISGNKMHSIDGPCISVESVATTITKNTITGCNGAAVYVSKDGPTITSNLINGNVDGDTIVVNCGDNATISGNKAVGGNDDEDFISVCQNTSSHETITNNIESAGLVLGGVYCVPCDDATVTGNEILGGGEAVGVSIVGHDPVVNSNVVAGGWHSYGFAVNCTASCGTAQVEKNKESGSYDSFGYTLENDGCSGAFPCMTISGNTATDNRLTGLEFDTSYAAIMSNTASYSGYAFTGCFLGGFDLEGGHNQLTGNTATRNACDGFFVDAASNTLTSNVATGNFVHGFQVENDGNTLDKNTSTGNMGDGFNNDGTNTVFTNNKASGNRQDCTNDNAAPSNEGATIATNTGNTCADHHIFDLPSLLSGW